MKKHSDLLGMVLVVSVQDIVDISKGRIRTSTDFYGSLETKNCSRCPEPGQLVLQRYFAFKQGMLMPHPNRREANEHTATSIVGNAAAIGPKK